MKYRLIEEKSVFTNENWYCTEQETELGWVMVAKTRTQNYQEARYMFEEIISGTKPIEKTVIREVEV